MSNTGDQDLLLHVWQYVCQHVEFSDVMDGVFSLLHAPLSISELALAEIDAISGRVEVVRRQVGPTGVIVSKERPPDLDVALLVDVMDRPGSMAHIPLPSAKSPDGQAANSEAHWRHEPAARPAQWIASVLRGVTSSPVSWTLLAQTGSAIRLILLVSEPAVRLTERQLAFLEQLHEPLQTAFHNEARFLELRNLREAAEAENRLLASKLSRGSAQEIIGAEVGLRAVMERVTLVARSDVPILLLGETGSGKEVIARAIHEQSPRVTGPFMRVNCGAIAPELVDSELFGHEKGSFTGATGQRKGWFERADKGTLLLDECGELSLPVQVRLLRILQEGSFERVGGERQVQVDVRIIAATHRDLQSMVMDGTFRQDLWYRLAVFPIQIPPLRDRQGDIAAMATEFALRAAHRFGVAPSLPTDADFDLLRAYPWPGNVRELRAVIDRAAILGNGKRLEIAKALGYPAPSLVSQNVGSASVTNMSSNTSLPQSTPFGQTGPPAPGNAGSSTVSRIGGRIETLDEAMKRHIENVLSLTQGRIEGHTGAARLLGINPHTLRGRMRKLKIDWNRFRPALHDFRDTGANI